MGKEDKAQLELSESSSLIDFLYVDKERVDSLISQLRNGTLRSVTKTIGTSEGSFMSGKGNIEVVSGKIASKNKTKEEASEEYDPYHSQIIGLLNDLSISPLQSLPSLCSGKLVCIQAPIKIRDLRSIKKLMPVLEKNSKFFQLPNNHNIKNIFKAMTSMIEAMDDSIELSIKFDSTLISGTLREGCLSIQQSDLNRTYGIDLPGKWYILGILDSQVKNNSENIISSPGTIEDAIDACTTAINQLYSNAHYGIVPILIYREIKY